MARKVTVEMIDDFDSKSVAQETVVFAVDGVGYEIDLSVDNSTRLREVFERWTPHARRTSRTPRRKTARVSVDRQQSQRMRDWARANGMTVSYRGRISAEVVQAYQAANIRSA